MNVLDLHLTSSQGFVKLSNELQRQRLRLIYYRAEFDAAADALGAQYLRVRLPCIDSTNLQVATDSDTTYPRSFTGIPILLENLAVTVREPDLIIDMTGNMTEEFPYEIIAAGSLANFNSLHLVFEYQAGEIV